MNETLKRTLTALMLILPVYAAFRFLPLWGIAVLVFITVSIAAWELSGLCSLPSREFPLAILNGGVLGVHFAFGSLTLAETLVVILISTGVFYLIIINNRERLTDFIHNFAIQFLVLCYLYFPLYFLLRLVQTGQASDRGPALVFFLVWVVAIGDSGAYFIGRWMGRHKIYPVASPNKTLEGLMAAVITGGLAGGAALYVFRLQGVSLPALIGTGALMGGLSQISDPLESLFKRSARRKDSGEILPGHGGMLDRLDSYIFCGPVFYLIAVYLWFH